ncbi:MAG: phosphatidate cytidylyltransferase [Bdellovibrionales bacterium]|nr:phosphatidate cytidylyltransferase [Bdellovibrionales bacterium]
MKAPKLSGLKARVISALIALFLILATAYQFKAKGLEWACILVVFLIVREYKRTAFSRLIIPHGVKVLFSVLCFALLISLLWLPNSLLVFSFYCSLFIALTFWLTRNKTDNETILTFLSRGIFGFLWCVAFPCFEIYTLRQKVGLELFALHLMVVFAGDIGAYFGGKWLGKKALMPQVSPNKTIEGALSGLLCSFLCAVFCVLSFFPQGTALGPAIAFGLGCGFIAQMGDLTISLLKRVAQIKDSGRLMPGHGGMLDRLDGVLMSSPLIYFFTFYSSILSMG